MKFASLWESLTHTPDRDGQRLQYEATLGLIVDLRNGKTPVGVEQRAKMIADLNADINNNNSGRIGYCLVEAQELYQHEVREVCGCDAAGQAPSLA